MRALSKLLLPLAVLVTAAGPAFATSPWLYGVVVSAKPAAGGGVTLELLILIDNYKAGNEQRLRSLNIAADTPVCLDWKRSTLLEALAPGRSVAFFQNHEVRGKEGEVLSGKYTGSRHGGALLVSTAPASARPAPLGAAECSLLIATLDKPGDLSALTPEPPKAAVEARLVLEHKDGHITAGVVWTPGLDGGFWHEADVAGLKLEGGRLSGVVKVTFVGANGKTAEASYGLNGTAEGGGTFQGTCAGAAVSGKLAVMGQTSTRPGQNARLWLWTQDDRFTGPGGKGDTWSYLSCLFAEGKSASGYLCFRKSYVNGVLADAALMLEGAALKGVFTAKIPGADAGGTKTALEGRILDGRFVFATLKVGEKQETVRAYGFLLHPDAAPVVLPGSESGKH